MTKFTKNWDLYKTQLKNIFTLSQMQPQKQEALSTGQQKKAIL